MVRFFAQASVLACFSIWSTLRQPMKIMATMKGIAPIRANSRNNFDLMLLLLMLVHLVMSG
jgi:uncharacterized membrane protein